MLSAYPWISFEPPCRRPWWRWGGLGYFGLGEFTTDVWLLLAITLPMTLIGIYFGNRIFAEVSEVRFRWLVSLTLMVSGFALLVK